MKRPILVVIIGYLIGIIWGLYLKINITPFYILITIIIALLNKIFINNKKIMKYYNKIINKKLIIIIIISSIISNTIVNIENNKYNTLYKNLKEIEIIGTIISNKKEKEYYNSYKIKVYSINNNSKKYKNTNLLINMKKDIELEYGDLIKIKGEYVEPNKSRNYKGFDYKEYLKSEKIYGTITNTKDINIMKKNNCSYFEKISNIVKNNIENNIRKILNTEEAEILIGILLGNTESINDETIQSFRDSSLYHILAVSGAHVAYLITAIAFILNKIKVDTKKGKIITIIILIFFMFLTGFTPSVSRACFMAIIMLVAKIIGRKLDIINSISLSLLIILIINPFSIRNLGLILSYGGTIGIVIFQRQIKEKLEKIFIKKQSKFVKAKKQCIEIISVTLSAQIIIAPIIMLEFNTISLTFVLSNLLAGYIMGPITILGFIFSSISFLSINIAKILKFPLEILIKALLILSKFSSKLPFSNITIITPSFSIILAYYILIVIKKYFPILNTKIKNIINKITIKKIILISIISIFTFQIINVIPKDLIIHFIDVGQGDSCLVITPCNKKILIDTGGSKLGESYDVGESTLLPYLLDRKIYTLDYLIISHFDADHCNGVVAILNKLNIKKIVVSEQGEICAEYAKIMQIVNEKNIKVVKVKSGDKIIFDKYTYFEILHPQKQLIQENILNNNSIVGKLKYINFSMLFTGDIEKIAEDELIKLYKNNNKLKSDILKVPHHGSKTSSTEKFLELIKPKVALIGVGEKNTFGHPNQDVIERIENLGTKVYRTDKRGEISIVVNRKGKIKVF